MSLEVAGLALRLPGLPYGFTLGFGFGAYLAALLWASASGFTLRLCFGLRGLPCGFALGFGFGALPCGFGLVESRAEGGKQNPPSPPKAG